MSQSLDPPQRDLHGYRRLGAVEDYPQIEAIYTAIFERAPGFRLADGTRLRTKSFCEGKILGVDYKGHRYLEQNPEKNSLWGYRAREGARIMWIIQAYTTLATTNQLVPCNFWVGRVEDGIVWRK